MTYIVKHETVGDVVVGTIGLNSSGEGNEHFQGFTVPKASFTGDATDTKLAAHLKISLTPKVSRELKLTDSIDLK